MTKLVWNGVDGYIKTDDTSRMVDYDFDGSKLYTQRDVFTAFDVEPVETSTMPIDADGEFILSNDLYLLDTGEVFRLKNQK